MDLSKSFHLDNSFKMWEHTVVVSWKPDKLKEPKLSLERLRESCSSGRIGKLAFGYCHLGLTRTKRTKTSNVLERDEFRSAMYLD